MSHEKLKSLDNLDDMLIVRKIDANVPPTRSKNESIQATQCLCFQSGCDCNRNVLVEEHEAIVKKQLQMLQADERGKQALIIELAALKDRQENRSQLLRYRQRALDIEKERARKIAYLPPPLPKSVKSLLKKNDNESKLSKPDVQMPDELTAITVKPLEIGCKNTENKENIADPEDLELRQKMQEEWDMKAKKRFYEAVKKDRQKEEYTKIMKQIQNAELLNRREMAKNISADKKGMPCPLSDKFQTTKKQADMEDMTERIFKKTGTKEHVIEDIEGYQDHYEEKYKKIDSTCEAKMINCVPSFIKENYEYLLEDNSKFVGGKNFSGLDDSCSDILNQAYIEVLPGADELHGTEEFHEVISHFDRLRSVLETEIENIKPLLAAAIEIPKKESKDQAVGTESIKVPAEDKAVETDSRLKNETTSPSPTATFNFINSGVMAYKRRPHLPVPHTFEEMPVHDMRQRDVHYKIPSSSESEGPTGSWSPSTYCSLPSKHGIPAYPSGPKSEMCDICIAEKVTDQLKDNFVQESTPTSVMFNEEKHRNLTVSSRKTPLSEYLRPLAQKYLSTNSIKKSQQNENISKSSGDSAYSNTMLISPAFEKEVIGKSKIGVFNEPNKSKKFNSVPEKNTLPEEGKKSQTSPSIIEKLVPALQTETAVKTNEAENEMSKSEKLQDDIKIKITDNELQESPREYSPYDYEVKRIQAIHQVVTRKFPISVLDSNKSKEKENETEPKQLMSHAENEIANRPAYRNLSTILEVDSALTDSNLQLSQSKLSDISETKGGKDTLLKDKLNNFFHSAKTIKMVSLLDPPDTEIAKLAKSIHFVPENEKKISHSLETSERALASTKIDKSTYSNEYLSTPTLATGSYSSVSMSTPSLPLSSSCQSISSAKSRENKDNQNCSTSRYNSDFKVRGMTESEVLHARQDKKDINTIISERIINLDAPHLSSADIFNPRQQIREINSIPSGYISDLEVPHTSADAYLLGKANNDTTLSGYISDLDHLKKIASDKDFLLKQGQFITQMSPEKNFRPMTPHSNVSSSSESNTNDLKKDFQNYSRSENFKPVIPYSVSKPTKFADHFKDPRDDRTGNFKPMTPHFNVSSPSELTLHNFEKDHQNANFPENLKSTPLFPNKPSPSELLNLAVKNYIQYGNSAGSFKALTPRSNVSSPSSDIFCLNDKYLSSFGSFKALTPHSNVSSPDSDVFLPFKNVAIDDASSSGKLRDKISPNNMKNQPITLRFDISTDSLTINTIENKPSDTKHVSQLNCNLTLKTLLKPTNCSLTTQVPRTDITSGTIDNRKYDDKSKEKVKKRRKGLHLSAAKQYALACSSDFFIPCMNEDSNLVNENKGLPRISTEDNDDIYKPETVFGSRVSISDDAKKIEEKLVKIPKEKESDSKPTILNTKISKKPAEELLTMKSKETLQAQVQVENTRKQCSNLQGLSSSSSSTESLSVISRSKVVCQSTPIKKNVEEILPEPCILEEPTLTLVDLTCKIDTTRISRGPLTSDEPLHQEKNCIAEFSQNKCRTPISLSPQCSDTPDTPSMMSFLQHEMSCIQQASHNNVLVPSPTDNNPVSQNFDVNNTPPLREVKRSLFQRTGYKERTKRLWSNLEEVRKKNIAEARKKEIENNRRKAKEFSKKLTPKRRNN